MFMKDETVTISRKEYERLKKQIKIDPELLEQLRSSFKDIREGKVKRTR